MREQLFNLDLLKHPTLLNELIKSLNVGAQDGNIPNAFAFKSLHLIFVYCFILKTN